MVKPTAYTVTIFFLFHYFHPTDMYKRDIIYYGFVVRIIENNINSAGDIVRYKNR